jgi:OPA family glycerol-3-phosphate transporter-like MFS transporter
MGLSWRWIFRGPVLLLFCVGILYYFVARDRPRDLGFDQEDGDPEAGADANSAPNQTESAIIKYKTVLSNVRFLFGCVAIGLQNLARYGLLVWVPVHFLGENWKEPGGTKWLSVFLPIGMAVGAFANGWISDRVFHGNRSKAIVSFLSLAAVSSLIMWMLPVNHPLVIPALFTTGFFVYGPQASFWALCPDTFGTQRAGTATGVMNFFAYLFAGAGEPLIGWLIDSQGNTGIVFIVVAGATTLSALFALVIKR